MRAVYFLCAFGLCMSVAEARPRRQYQSGQPVQNVVRAVTNTAQGVAEACARMGRLQHMGGHGGMMEGIGMASTPEAAVRNCCYYGQIQIMDQGTAQGPNGMWYACIRGR
jgi:hypothetical protein